MRRLLTLLMLSLSVHALMGQGREVKLPVAGYPDLDIIQPAVKQTKTSSFLRKAGASAQYPFIDWFQTNTLNDTLWQSSNATYSSNGMVFNAQDANGATYPGASGAADVLKSNQFAYYPSNEAYAYFTYSTGNSWAASDSLILRLKSSGGTMVQVWSSPATAVTQQTVIVPINNLIDYLGSGFYFELVAYTGYSGANTQTFLLHQFALSEKWNLPQYENFFSYDSIHKLPSSHNWLKTPTHIYSNIETGKGRSNTIVFDAYNERQQLYNNGNGQFGTTDVLLSNLINLTSFAPTDGVYLRFFAKALPNALPGDSLLLEYLNKAGDWIKIWSMTGAQQGDYIPFLQNINYGKFPGPNFQFRLSLRCHYTAADTLKFLIAGIHIGNKTVLPFLDDFSTSNIYPDRKKWTNSNTYINNRFAIKPPSVNVATFDGLDRYGNAYKNVARYADTLTSVPINLSGISLNDTNVYLSFWVQSKGRGDLPNSGDSLVLEFRTSATQPNAYQVVWRGARGDFATDSFRQILVQIDSIFFHDDFQFRFKNKCNKLGNLEHWHIDFVRLDNSGKADLTYYNDVNLSEAPGSLLTPYNSMPYDHFLTNPATYVRASQQITARNLKDVAKPIRYAREVFDPTGLRIDTIGNPIGSVISSKDITLGVLGASLNAPATGDSTVYLTRYTATSMASGDNNIYTNDSISVPTIFSNYFAYDDGSAENGYAIMNTTGAVALKYTLPKADKLYGVSIFFNQSINDVSSRNFTLKIWKAINTNGNGTGEQVIAEFPLLTPVYTNKINGFYYYPFSSPIDLTAGDFYIGWEQDQVFALNIGCDENFEIAGNSINPNGYVFLDDFGLWAQTEVTGAVMMRPIIGKWIDPPVGLNSLIKDDPSTFGFYPNPATENINLTPADARYASLEIIEMSGRMVYKELGVKGQLNLSNLGAGIYLLKATSELDAVSIKKLVIR